MGNRTLQSRHRRLAQGERGFTMLLFVASASVLIGFVGLAVDVGYEMHQKRHMQAAADAGAIAAALELSYGNAAGVTAAGQNDAGLNGFTNGTAGAIVTVNNPPTAGSYSGNANYAEVLVSQAQPTFFMRIFNFNSVPMMARSVAGVGGGSSACIFLLNPNFEAAYYTDGSTTTTVDCGMQVNSNSSKSITNLGTTAMAGPITTVGGVMNEGSLSPDPGRIPGPVVDPLASMPVPTPSGLSVRSSANLKISGTTTIFPGIYNGGISIGQGANVTMQPGLYYLNNGGLFMTKAALSGDGVTIFLTGTQSQTPVLADSVSTMRLSAPTASANGAMEGILFFLDRKAEYWNLNWGINIQSNGTNKFEGVLYFPTSGVLWESAAAADLGAYTIIVAQILRIDGSRTNLTIHNDYSSLSSGNPIKTSVQLGE